MRTVVQLAQPVGQLIGTDGRLAKTVRQLSGPL